MTSQPLPALSGAFLRRTAFAILITTGLVALFSAVYYDPVWAGRYMFFALWALAFHALFPAIFKAMLARKQVLGFALIMAKVALLAAVFVVIQLWPFPEGEGRRAQVLAMLFGVSTPLFVLILRVLGFMMELTKKIEAGKSPIKPVPSIDPGNSKGELRPNS